MITKIKFYVWGKILKKKKKEKVKKSLKEIYIPLKQSPWSVISFAFLDAQHLDAMGKSCMQKYLHRIAEKTPLQ